MFALVKFLSFIFLRIPPQVSLFFARILGRVYYCLDFRHRLIAYRNLRLALCDKFSPAELHKILKTYYLNLAQNFTEVLYMPKIDSSYIKKYIKIEGESFLREFAKDKKGIIFTSAHFGNWEIPNIVSKYLFPEKPYFVLVRPQTKSKKIDELLNSYRQGHGFDTVATDSAGLRKAFSNLKKGAFLGMVIDQGIGESNAFIDFFKHRVAAPTGAVKLALRFDAPLILTYIRRIKGPYLSLKILAPLELKKDVGSQNQIQENVQALNKQVEEFITRFPTDYLWQFRRFKSRLQRNILILDDGKLGHLRQSEAVAEILARVLRRKKLSAKIEIVNFKFKSKFAKVIFDFLLKIFNLSFARGVLSQKSFERLFSFCPDFVISAGESCAGLNLILSRESQSKSIVIMRPSFFSVKSFDLVISPKHDRIKQRQNVVKVLGAPNIIDSAYLKNNSKIITQQFSIDEDDKRLKIGLLLGGNTKNLKLDRQLVEAVCDQILGAGKRHNAQILLSTSRRTPADAEAVIKEKFKDNDLVKLLVIANEKNIPHTVGAILGLCQIVVVSSDSISMVSEAVSSGKYVIVFRLRSKTTMTKHERFLLNLKQKGYIYFADSGIEKIISEIWMNKPPQEKLQDAKLIEEAVERIL
ncbi:MAG: mitochondrial fission ELM1 family protein [Candidatus Omnitrophica bacterium]|nr:mitochondrial fission ELM1 family protein [Candidatus Omnitrophota bacterium]